MSGDYSVMNSACCYSLEISEISWILFEILKKFGETSWNSSKTNKISRNVTEIDDGVLDQSRREICVNLPNLISDLTTKFSWVHNLVKCLACRNLSQNDRKMIYLLNIALQLPGLHLGNFSRRYKLDLIKIKQAATENDYTWIYTRSPVILYMVS